MAQGTKFLIKDDLLEAVERVRFNTSFKTASEKIQESDKDIIESLWDRGVSIEAFAAYGDLTTAITNSTLSPGQYYSVPYETIHVIPGTANVLNTASAEYIQKVETFIFQATSVNTVESKVRSLEHPNDIILWDTNMNLAEDGITPRSGKVVYREDPINRLSTYYDFRAVLFRRGTIDTAGSIPLWTTGQNWSRNDLAIFPGDVLKRAYRDMAPDNSGEDFEWQDIGPSTTTMKWIWKDSATYSGSAIPRTDLQDYLTFPTISNDIHVGYSTQNNGYNNIVFNNCSRIKLGNGSYDAHFDTTFDVNIETSCINSLLGVTQRINLFSSSSSYLWASNGLDLIDPSSTAIWACSNLTVGPAGVGNNLSLVTDSNIGSKMDQCTLHYIQEITIGANFDSNIVLNVKETTIESNVNNNILAGISYSEIRNNVRNCNFDADASLYNVYEYVTIEEDCFELSSPANCNVTRVVFGKASGRITLASNSTLDNVTFGQQCLDFTLDSNSTIRNCTFGSNTDDFTVISNSTLERCHFGQSCNSFDFSNGATVRDVTVGSNSFGWEIGLTASGTLNRCQFGSGSSLILDGGSTMNDAWVGENVDNIELLNGSSITDSHIGNEFGNINMNNGSSIQKSVLHTSDNLQLDGSTIEETVINPGCDNISLNNGATIARSVLRPGFSNKTFDGATQNSFSDYVYKSNSATLTLDNVTNLAKTINTISPTITANVMDINMFDATEYLFEGSNAADLTISMTGTPGNIDIDFILENTDGVAHNVDFVTVGGTTTVVVSIPATTRKFIRVRRVLTGALDEMIVVQDTTLA